jgi:hypothetical protein
MNPPFHPQSVCPSANFPSFHLPHTETHPWGPHPPPVFQANCAPPGPTMLHWGTHFCICTLIPNYSLFIVQMPLLPTFTLPFCRHPWRPSSLFCKTQPMLSLVGALLLIYPLTTSSISSEHPTGHLPMPSEFVHFVPPLAQLIPYLVVPLTLDLVERLQPLFTSHIPPTKGSLESSYILTLSMYLSQIPKLT